MRLILGISLLLFAAWPTQLPGDEAELRWYRGNLHTHSLWSDGNDFPEVICDWYKRNGYQFVALSDHNVLAEGQRWMRLSTVAKRSGGNALKRYRERFGDEWVELRGQDKGREVRLRTLAEYRKRLEEPKRFLLIQGEEITDKFGRLPVHINATNLRELIRPQGGTSVPDVIRRNLRAVTEQSRRLDVPILPHLNHPNFGWAVTAEQLAEVVEERFFEVFNGHPSVRHRGDEKHPGVEHLWDIANTLRLTTHRAPPLYGLATDDAHHYFGPRGAITGRGWVMVRAPRLTPQALIAAMTRGEFYASTGVTLRSVHFDDKSRILKVEIDPAPEANYVTRFIGTRRTAAGADNDPQIGEVFAEVKGPKPTYRLSGDELYVRAMVLSDRPVTAPVWSGQKRQAWTQPVGWRVP
ncbi:MAG: hypothetical protein OER86_10630 [Phycisphaerae bacterium]|nr:hypothetical protein [Phycisphaerae bacterium]